MMSVIESSWEMISEMKEKKHWKEVTVKYSMDSISLYYSLFLILSVWFLTFCLGKLLSVILKQPKRGLRLFENHAWSTLYSGKNGGEGGSRIFRGQI